MTFLSRFFTSVLARSWWVLGVYALILPPSIYFAARMGQDNSIDRLIVPSDPDFVATRAFEKVFGSGEFAVLMAEADDPLSAPVVAWVDRVERAVQAVPGVTTNSPLTIFRRARAGFEPTAEQIAALRAFVTGTELLRRQGLVGDRFLGVALVLATGGSPWERMDRLAAIDRAIDSAGPPPPELRDLSRLGLPYVNAYLDQTQGKAWQHFAVFVAFIVGLNIFLYRSGRTLAAFLITLGVCMATSLAYIGATGGELTIVSPMVPMSILVTAMATLVYLHSRFVERPPERPLEEHHVYALENKFVACTASLFATAVGFAALLVSPIRPIRDMGEWVAAGLLFTWIICFTLFPALQKVLRTPTQTEQRTAGEWFVRFAKWLPRFTYRWRGVLFGAATILWALGLVALFGLPGLLGPMRIRTDPVKYMNPSSALYKDIMRLQPMIPGLSLTQVWLKGSVGSVSEVEVLNGLHAYQQALEREPEVGAAVGPTSILRLIRYIGGAGDAWPTDPEELEQAAADLEGLTAMEPMLQRFVEPRSLSQTQLTVISRTAEHQGFLRLERALRRHWQEAASAHPALRGLEMRVVGLSPLQAKMAQALIPTLVESFVITVAVIFAAFLVVFRNGTARLLAMIPSIFSILVMFLVMRLVGLPLNVGTILIAATVLGTSENDQIHFFYHYLEKRDEGAGIEAALRHTLLIAGRAIFFATLINAGGFLAFGFAELPPMAQFGLLSALAFLLSMIADFSALPAALWVFSGARPELDD